MKEIEKIKPLFEYIDTVTEDLKARTGKQKIPIESLPAFNNQVWGFKDGELVVIGARTSQGKSAFVAQLALDFAKQGIEVLFLSLEMMVEEIIERMFCCDMGVSNELVLKGKYYEYEQKWGLFCKKLTGLSTLTIASGLGKTFEEINFLVDRWPRQIKVVIVDYVQAVKTTTKDTREQINEYIRRFRELSISRKFCGILVSQINREAMKGEAFPTMAQLKYTGVLEEHSDKVILLYWPFQQDHQDMHDFKLILAKNRNGRTGVIDLFYEPQCYQFREKV